MQNYIYGEIISIIIAICILVFGHYAKHFRDSQLFKMCLLEVMISIPLVNTAITLSSSFTIQNALYNFVMFEPFNGAHSSTYILISIVFLASVKMTKNYLTSLYNSLMFVAIGEGIVFIIFYAFNFNELIKYWYIIGDKAMALWFICIFISYVQLKFPLKQFVIPTLIYSGYRLAILPYITFLPSNTNLFTSLLDQSSWLIFSILILYEVNKYKMSVQ